MGEGGQLMAVNAKYIKFLKYDWFRKIIKSYYQHKLHCQCFLMFQNNKWTIVTINM